MKKKDSAEAKRFWELAENTSKDVEAWPKWKRDFASTATAKVSSNLAQDAAAEQSATSSSTTNSGT